MTIDIFSLDYLNNPKNINFINSYFILKLFSEHKLQYIMSFKFLANNVYTIDIFEENLMYSSYSGEINACTLGVTVEHYTSDFVNEPLWSKISQSINISKNCI